MAVYHCRCAFLSFFLLHKQKKEHTSSKKSILKCLSFLCLDTKKGNKRKIKPGPMLRRPGRPTHMSIHYVFYRTDRTKILLRVIYNLWKRCLFRLHSLEMMKDYKRRKRRRWQFSERSINVQYQSAKDISIIVDVDDKNCLAQLTVALKLNHGVRQRLYIVAGALFFYVCYRIPFFCASKRK